MAGSNDVTPDEARRAAGSLRAFWKAGQKSLARLAKLRKKNPDAYRRGAKKAAQEAEAKKCGLNPDTLLKAWRVAEEYEEADIEALCELVEKHAARFGRTHLLRLLAVGDRARRDALAKEAVEGRWGLTRLEAAILGRRERKLGVGRKPRVAEDEGERLAVLEGLCLRWTRWCAGAAPKVPKDLAPLLGKATVAVAELEAALKARTRAGRKKSSGQKRGSG
jgi:hypothetical protein